MEKQDTLPFALDVQFFAEGEGEDGNEEEQIGSDELTDPEEAEEAQADETPHETDDAGPADKAVDDGKAKPRDRKRDAEFADKRREAEKAAKEKAEKENLERIRREAYEKGRIEGIGGTNPYTKTPIRSAYDLHLYDLMKKADEEGKNPLEELPSKLSQEREEEERARQDEAKKAEEERKAEQARIDLANRNIEDLGKAYPHLDRAWFASAYKGNRQFRQLVDHGFTPKEAAEFLGLEKTKEQAEPQSTPTSVPQGTPKPKASNEDEEAFVRRMEETHGSFF